MNISNSTAYVLYNLGVGKSKDCFVVGLCLFFNYYLLKILRLFSSLLVSFPFQMMLYEKDCALLSTLS